MAYTPNHVFRTEVTMAAMAICFVLFLPLTYFFEDVVYELVVVSVLVGLVTGVVADMRIDKGEE